LKPLLPFPVARRFAVVTTCNAKGYAEYGRKMVETFLAHWPAEVPLLLFHEGFEPPSASARVIAIDLLDASPALSAFKARHATNPRANGRVRPWFRMGRLALSLPIADSRNRFRWDAVRFAHKCYAIFEAARRTQADVLIWIDADSVFFADVSMGTSTPCLRVTAPFPACGGRASAKRASSPTTCGSRRRGNSLPSSRRCTSGISCSMSASITIHTCSM